MSIKLIATDLDGTLMSPDHLTITQRTVSALEQAHAKDVKIAIATGRPMCIIGSVIEQIPFADYIIYSNGAGVLDRKSNEIIYESLIKGSDVSELIDYMLGFEVFFDVSYKGESHHQSGSEKYFADNDEFPSEFVEEVMRPMHPHESLKAFLNGEGVEKITLYTVKDSDYDCFKEKLSSYGFSVATSFKGNLEATSPSADKGSAVAGICRVLGITAESAMTFGDAGNDRPMLEFADYSFAMGNATEECKQSAKYITDTNGNDGLAIAVEKYVLNK